jgi:hypothetical protein
VVHIDIEEALRFGQHAVVAQADVLSIAAPVDFGMTAQGM